MKPMKVSKSQEGVAEALQRISEAKTKKEKIALLRSDHNKTMEHIVNICFHPNIHFVLPEGPAPYKSTNKANDQQTFLKANLRKMRIFTNHIAYQNIKNMTRENQYVQFLEGCDPDDAAMLEHIRNKGALPFAGLTKKLFEEAWPALASEWKKDNWPGGYYPYEKKVKQETDG